MLEERPHSKPNSNSAENSALLSCLEVALMAAEFPWHQCLLVVSETIDLGLHVIDTNGVTLVYNSKAAALDGVAREQMLERPLLEVFPSLTPETSRLLTAVRTGKPIPSSHQTYVNYKGQTVSVINTTQPVIINGEVVGAVELMTDISSLAQATDRFVTLLQTQLSSDYAPNNDRLSAFEDTLTQSPKVLRAIELARRASAHDSPVFVYGETGTGKELIVQAIHKASGRSGILVEQNCAALPETLLESTLFGVVAGAFTGARDRPGLLELCKHGTLYLDEINSMPRETQAKLLRALQDNYVRRVGDTRNRPTSFRVLASCNVDPFMAIEQGVLRADLFYRLSTVLIELPPLRDRGKDLYLLAAHFLKKVSSRPGIHAKEISPEVWSLFQQYRWPGNVRELMHVIEHAALSASGPLITLDSLPQYMLRSQGRPTAPEANTRDAHRAHLREEVSGMERDLILTAMKRAGGNVSRAARDLGIPRQTLQSKIKRLGLSSNFRQ